MKPYQDIQHVSDVLSSIRQLVSDEVSNLDKKSSQKHGSNVLVLTASNRIDATFRSRHTAAGDDAMREMIRSIIREELQGDLGDRITRNVRKMVRREISRALNISLTD